MPIYRIILILGAPVVAMAMLIRLMLGKETRAGLRERLGRGGAPHAATRKTCGIIWLHGASLGEMTAARPLIDALTDQIDDLHIIVTVNTYTARKMVRNWDDPAISVQMAPLDYPGILRRFLESWAPGGALTLENEIWPMRILACNARQIPVLVVGGRMSARSARRWARLPGLSTRIMASISMVAPLDAANGDRFRQLGLPADRLAQPISLKSAVRLPDPDTSELAQLQSVFQRDKTILAASTHHEDEDLILSAFAKARAITPDLKLIVALRHPHRSDDVAQKISKHGLDFEKRSAGTVPAPGIPVFLADTIGEMQLWYALAGTTIIGGTFAARGGHTPVEPVQFGSVVVHGPDVANHAAAFAALHQSDAAMMVNSPSDLAAVFARAGGGPGNSDISRRATKAIDALRHMQADPSAIVDKVKTILK